MAAIVYLQLTDLDAFIEELKRGGIREARLSEWIQTYSVFEKCKLRLTALDRKAQLIICHHTTFYHDLAVNLKDKRDMRRLEEARQKARQRITTKLAEGEIKILNGEYHTGMAGW